MFTSRGRDVHRPHVHSRQFGARICVFLHVVDKSAAFGTHCTGVCVAIRGVDVHRLHVHSRPHWRSHVRAFACNVRGFSRIGALCSSSRIGHIGICTGTCHRMCTHIRMRSICCWWLCSMTCLICHVGMFFNAVVERERLLYVRSMLLCVCSACVRKRVPRTGTSRARESPVTRDESARMRARRGGPRKGTSSPRRRNERPSAGHSRR